MLTIQADKKARNSASANADKATLSADKTTLKIDSATLGSAIK
jgi:hypothetical protein